MTLCSSSIKVNSSENLARTIGMAADPTKLNDLEMLSLLALGLTSYMKRVEAGENDPFPYPNTLLCGFNQLLIICALRDVPRAQRPKSIPEFVANWAILPLVEWSVKLDVPMDVLANARSLACSRNQ